MNDIVCRILPHKIYLDHLQCYYLSFYSFTFISKFDFFNLTTKHETKFSRYCLRSKRSLLSRLYETVLEKVNTRLRYEEVVARGLFIVL